MGIVEQATHRVIFYSPAVEVGNAYSSFFRVTSLFRACGEGTAHEMIIEFGSAETRHSALGTGMLDGMEVCNELLDALIGAGVA